METQKPQEIHLHHSSCIYDTGNIVEEAENLQETENEEDCVKQSLL